MTPTFTPRTQPTSPAEKAQLVAEKKSAPDSIWSPLFRLLFRLLKWTLGLIRKLIVHFIRYIRGLSRIQLTRHMIIAVVILCAVYLIGQLLPRDVTTTPQTSDAGTHSGSELPKGTPDFSTILPSGKSVDTYGGWTRVSPADRNPVYAYTDTLSAVSIVVSEQPLPETFKGNTDEQIKTLAASYSAERTFEAGNATVYIGKSAKGPQSLIFTTRGLLILVKSSATISDDKWKDYVRSLR